MNMSRILSMIIALLSVGVRAVEVVLLGGQSNMQGIGKVADLPAEIPRAVPHTFFWNGKDFEPLVAGVTRSSTRPGEFGPEIGLGLGLGTEASPVYLNKHSASGMPLHAGWNAAKWEGPAPGPGRVTFYPGEKSGDPNAGTLYLAMLKTYRAGLAHLEKSGPSPTVKGFVWMQGEADAKHEISAKEYGESLRRLRARLSEDLRLPAPVPLVFGQVLPHEPAMERFTHRADIRRVMAEADERSGRPAAQPGVRMVSTDGFGLLPDTVHYNAEGQLRLGRAFAVGLGKALR
jgi:hypothetical protein